VLLVEHDPDVVAQADWVIDVGPAAGRAGGEVVFAGRPVELAAGRQKRQPDHRVGRTVILQNESRHQLPEGSEGSERDRRA